MCHEIRDCINEIRRETRTRVIVLTGAGDKFFCIGGRKEGMEDTTLYAGTLPTLEMYEVDREAAEAGDRLGQRLRGRRRQRAADGVRLTIAKESAVFRQVGPMMGSFDAGYGTWYLEDLVGKKRAKEIWFRNPKITAREALAMGLINKVVPDAELKAATRSSRWRSPSAAPSRSPPSRPPSTPATAASRACRAWRTICCCAATSKATRARSWRGLCGQAQARPLQVRRG